MTKQSYLTLWGSMFVLCAGFGFIPEPEGALRVIMIALAIMFFLPPWLLLRRADAQGDLPWLRLVRNLAALSLGLTVAVLLANFLCLMAPEAVGNALYAVLVIVSAPMICGQYWVLGLFGWACLLMGSISLIRKKR